MCVLVMDQGAGSDFDLRVYPPGDLVDGRPEIRILRTPILVGKFGYRRFRCRFAGGYLQAFLQSFWPLYL